MSCFAPSSPAHDPTTSQMQIRANVARRKLESKEAAKVTTAPALKNSASDTSAAPAPKNLLGIQGLPLHTLAENNSHQHLAQANGRNLRK